MHDVLIADRYQVEVCLGGQQGTMAYRAISVVSQQPCLVLCIRVPEQKGERFIRRFSELGQRLQQLPAHPVVIRPIDVGVWRGTVPYLVFSQEALHMPLLSSLALPLEPHQALTLMLCIAQGLEHVHTYGIVHGNVSMSTLISSSDPDVPVRLAGLGLRFLLEAEGVTSVSQPYQHVRSVWGTYLGDPMSVAPENMLGAPFDEQSDIYGLGSIFVQLLEGLPQKTLTYLYMARHVEDRVMPEHLPEGFVPFLSQMLASHPEQRFDTFRELIRAGLSLKRSLDSGD